MSRNYDNWGKLVSAVARKIQLRELASCHSRNLSSNSSDSDNSFQESQLEFIHDMEVQSGMRRLHIVYFLSQKGLPEHPHLIRVHYRSRNGIRLRDVKKWLGELRGKDMPELFSWSYKRKYMTGYVWQDLFDDDLITPILDNDYVLKGSEVSPIPHNGGSEINETMVRGETEETEESELDMSLLQEFAPELNSKTQSSSPLSSTSATLESDYPLKQNTLRRIKASDESPAESRNCQEHSLVPEKSIHNPVLDLTLGIYVGKNLKNDSSPQNQPSGASFTHDELFSGSYDSLSELANFINEMKRMLERKDMETEDMKQKLLKIEVEAQLALAAKESELEELRPKVEILKVEADKAREEVNKANEKIKELEQKLKDCDVRAASAVEVYKNSDELKIVKHKFASKAFSIGFQFCVKQVLEGDPSFDTSHIDVKRLESSSSIVKI